MSHDSDLRRCYELVTRLDLDKHWSLSSDTRWNYATCICTLYPDLKTVSETQLTLICCNYHTEHQLLDILRDRDNPDHGELWTIWSQNALRILMSRYRNVVFIDESVLNLDDLVQEAMGNLWQALDSFRFQSRFQTWAFAVISNCFMRAYRSVQMQKRAPGTRATSLDAPGVAETLQPVTDETSPENVLANHVLSDLVQETLSQHPDVRLQLIFHLWANEDQPLRVIGDRLNLSVPRVHALLNQALIFLRNEPGIREWQGSIV